MPLQHQTSEIFNKAEKSRGKDKIKTPCKRSNRMDWTDYVKAIGAIAIPVVLAIWGFFSWKIRTNVERRIALENKLHEDRLEIYNKILKPYVILLIPEAAWKSNPQNDGIDKNTVAIQEMLSVVYREHGFRLSLFAADEVVRAYNDLMQYIFQIGKHQEDNKTLSKIDTKKIMALLGQFLLEIRKSTGNEATKLDKWDMLEWFVQDAKEYRNK